MGKKTAEKKNTPEKHAGPERHRPDGIASRIVLIGFVVLSLLVCLSLLTYHPRDVDYLSGGVESYVIHNWIGYFGAWVSWIFLLTMGFAAYPFVFIILLSFGRRLFSGKGLRPVGWEYWGSLLLIGLGFSMLFGIWPDLWQGAAAALNIRQTPGGVIGYFLCAPGEGWMRIIMNPTGSAVISFALIGVGFTVLWLYDWHALFLKKIAAAGKGGEEKAAERGRDGAKGLKQRLQEKREARRQMKAELRQKRAEREVASEASQEKTPKQKASKAKKTPSSEPAPATESKAVQKTPRRAPVAKARKKPSDYKLPPLELLHDGQKSETTVDASEIEHKKAVLQDTLDSFGIDAKVGQATSGPRVTLFEVKPAPGIKVERISRLSKNIAMELRAVSLRMLTPIPGKKSVGIEVPNADAATVSLRNLMKTHTWKHSKADIPLLLGRNIDGKPVVLDLGRAPHLLIAGATGSGKSVCINALIMSLLYRFTPEELKLVLVDPKVVEFSGYNTLPHLVVPVITDSQKVQLALRWAINEMEKRYKICAAVGARNIAAFNERKKSSTPEFDENGNEIPEKLPYIVIIIDELADIMMAAKKDVETSLARIAQLSRAVGIHTIIATQRPSVNVITGLIKANYPTRIAFQVTSQVDSRTILDGKGAESLLGRGDMLFRPPGASKVERNQSALVEDDEIDAVVDFVSSQQEPEFDMDVFKSTDSAGGGGGEGPAGEELSAEDESLVSQAIEVILRDRRATTSYVQRCLRIGYNRAAMIMEILEERGVIGPQVGTAPREILISDNQKGDENTAAESETAAEDGENGEDNASDGDEEQQ
ncbi:MAG: DNA translocase FtsK [Lentisphaeria bacterium]